MQNVSNSFVGSKFLRSVSTLVGFGAKAGNIKTEIFYSDFEDISISGSGGNSNKVTADADALTLRFAYGF